MVFTQFKIAFDSAVKKFNKLWIFGKDKAKTSEEIKNKLIKIAYMILEILEDVETEVDESQKEIEDILEVEEKISEEE